MYPSWKQCRSRVKVVFNFGSLWLVHDFSCHFLDGYSHAPVLWAEKCNGLPLSHENIFLYFLLIHIILNVHKRLFTYWHRRWRRHPRPTEWKGRCLKDQYLLETENAQKCPFVRICSHVAQALQHTNKTCIQNFRYQHIWLWVLLHFITQGIKVQSMSKTAQRTGGSL